MSAGDCRFIRLRGGRSSADSARGTRPSGLPSIACGRDEGRICPFICVASARQKDGGPKGRLRQVSPHVSILFLNPAFAEKEEEFNALTAETAQKLGVTVGEWNGLIENSGKNCFHADGVHPNEFGYGLFLGFIKQLTAQI